MKTAKITFLIEHRNYSAVMFARLLFFVSDPNFKILAFHLFEKISENVKSFLKNWGSNIYHHFLCFISDLLPVESKQPN